jgi:hypothetical protein
MLAAPVNRSVDGSDIEFVRTSAVMRGRSVPKSPKEPESSASGCEVKKSTLCLCMRRSRGIGFDRDGNVIIAFLSSRTKDQEKTPTLVMM